MGLRYRCLVIDHDDTSVDSSMKINYPAYLRILERFRPGVKPVKFEDYLLYAHKGNLISEYYQKVLNFSDLEVKAQMDMWFEYSQDKDPEFYPGFIDMLYRFKKMGGYIIVASHSPEHMIKRHYNNSKESHLEKRELFPDMIFGWVDDERMRKPSKDIILKGISAINYKNDENLTLKDVLVLDDLKTGHVLSKNAGVDFAWAGWGHNIPEIRKYMNENAKYSFSSVKEFETFMFQ